MGRLGILDSGAGRWTVLNGDPSENARAVGRADTESRGTKFRKQFTKEEYGQESERNLRDLLVVSESSQGF